LKIKEEIVKLNLNDLPKNNFNIEIVEEEFKNYINQLIENRLMIYNAIKLTSFVKVENNIISVKFNSFSSQNVFQEIQNEFLDILRPKVQNYYIEFNYIIEENTEKSFILSKEDIFKKMVQKNSFLLNLKEDFGLII